MKKKILALVVAASSAFIAVAAPTMHPYTLPATAGSRDQALGCLKADEIVKAGGKLELGKWYTDFTTCKKYCDDNGIPLLAIWSNAGCVHCWYTECCFTTDAFKEWAAANDAGKVIYCFMAGGEKGCPDQVGTDAYNWMYYGGGTKIKSYPFLVLWWKKGNVNHRSSGDGFCKNADGTQPANFLAEAGVPARTQNVIRNMTNLLKDWHPEPEVTYDGGWFSQTNYPYASLQAESTTKSVAVEIVRESMAPTNQTMTISAPGKTTATVAINWTAGQLAQTNVIANFNTKWFVNGKDVTLTLMDGKEVASTVKIACVAPENSSGNPKWIGKTFDFGEWTMDLDAAKDKVVKTGGKAYTLVSVQGSLWCPDCANVERNFLDVEDGKGNNRFAAWAKSKNIALVTVDIPNFNGPTEADYASPCLLSRTAYQSTLARAKEYPQSGADAALTNKMWRSGLGYLTRNEVSDADAAKVFSRNHDLVKKNTYEGGFHRPEDTKVYRTGVPIFVLLRKDGSVAARLTRMAAVSPMASDKANFDNYIKRFEEMLTIADNNATEIENNYASASNELTLQANGGTEEATISHTDTMDVFRLDGVGGNALQSVKVTGACADSVIVSLLTTNAAGQAETLATSGAKKLSGGIELEHTFEKAGSYFVKVEVADITSASFKLESANSTFQSYTVKGSVVLVPQEDKATAKPPAGSDKVTIKLTAGTRYYITGMESCAALEAVVGAPAGFYVATQGGNAEMTLTQVDGEVSYQEWNAGSVWFLETGRTVSESVCDRTQLPLNLFVARKDGKSGWAKMTITVDASKTTLPAERYWLLDANSNKVSAVEVDWADGETGMKPVLLYIDDTLSKGLYDGTMYVALQAAVSSQAGDVKAGPGADSCLVTVIEDDVQAPGKVLFFDAEPSFARPCTVFARASEGVGIWAKRIDGSDGLVAAALVSTVSGAKFATEDPSDLGTLAEVSPELAKEFPAMKDIPVLWWSSRETKEKCVQVTGIPAGKTAQVYLKPIGNLGEIAASNKVTVVSVADDAPGFLTNVQEVVRIRYVDQNPVEIGVTNLVKDGVVSFSKLSGTLPAGVKVGFVRTGDTLGSMTVSGAATAKPGTYEAVYQVREKRGRETVNGLALRLTVIVNDPILTGMPGVPEPVAAVRKTRTFKDVPVTTEDGTRLMGLLQITIPPTGKASAKFVGIDGTVSYSAKAWSGYSPSPAGWELQSALASSKGDGATLGLVVNSDGSFGANLIFKKGEETVTYAVASLGNLWSKENPADDYEGYYTVALKHKKVLSEDVAGVAPTGDGYMALKMNTKSAVRSGTFTLAGRLPNGTAFSGSAVLAKGEEKALLPVCKVSSKEALTVLAGIAPNAQETTNRRCVESPALCDGYWRHTERAELKGSYEVAFQACGSYYDTDEDLGGCCAEYYETTDLLFYFDGEPGGVEVKVEDDTVRIGSVNVPLLTLNFNRSTGVITGTSKHPSLGLSSRVSYAGIVVNGWGEGCGCGPGGEIFLPFMSGSYFYRDGRLTAGGSATIDK